MDFSTLFSGGSAIAAIVSVFFAIVSWYQSLGSKKAKAKAEEAHKAALEMRDAAVRAAEAAEERARQMEQIVAEQQKQSESQGKIESHLWRPTFELTPDRGDTYLLRNVTGESVEVLEVANLDKFVRCDQVQQVFRPGESRRIFMFGASGKPLPSNLELRIRGVDEVVPSRFADSSRSFSSFFSSQESLSVLKQKNPETIAAATLMKKQTALNTRLNWSGSISVFLPGWLEGRELVRAVPHEVFSHAEDAGVVDVL